MAGAVLLGCSRSALLRRVFASAVLALSSSPGLPFRGVLRLPTSFVITLARSPTVALPALWLSPACWFSPVVCVRFCGSPSAAFAALAFSWLGLGDSQSKGQVERTGWV